jgi:hypothetical protein
VRSVPEVAGSQEGEIPAIGTLNEGALHAQLKNWYQRPDDRIERVIDGFVVDLVRGDLQVEIQTGSFAPLRRKLELLTRQHPVRLVAPVPLVRRIVRLSDEGELLSVAHLAADGRRTSSTAWGSQTLSRGRFPHICSGIEFMNPTGTDPAERWQRNPHKSLSQES